MLNTEFVSSALKTLKKNILSAKQHHTKDLLNPVLACGKSMNDQAATTNNSGIVAPIASITGSTYDHPSNRCKTLNWLEVTRPRTIIARATGKRDSSYL
ncbi:hypothetical protein AVEN_257301-1 [Araneus ventricosus]|uniref:Uncharacterized protein n=1 Tax=Araneus ventricosus TaxID=182803 RepID=A0A4Y2UZS9_ARAVE|nr:hypothetical protein AVEN_257301-1 [Araneus ventricosus]